jgi:hypothetical protein
LIEGYYEKEPKLPMIYRGGRDDDYQSYWDKRQIAIEEELSKDDIDTSKFQLTGEETLTELNNMLDFYNDLYEEAYQKADEDYATEIWDTMVTIEEAIDEWNDLNGSVETMLEDQGVENPPKYNKIKDDGKDKK